MIVIISNRNINAGVTDENLFGDDVNPAGIDTLRLAIANYNDDTNQWELDLKPEESSSNPPPSKQLFDEIASKTGNLSLPKAQRLTPYWVYYMHGFNKDMADLLDECLHIQDAFRVNVITFAWPSNPGGFPIVEFKRAKKNAEDSIAAFDTSLGILKTYLNTATSPTPIVPTLMMHSLGNYLFENWVESPLFNRDKIGIFRNIILHQAAVVADKHEQWLDRIDSSRVYVTLNNRDEVLRAAQVARGLQLGQLDKDFKAKTAQYINFTGAYNVRGKHNIYRTAIANLHIHAFCRESLKGREGEDVDGFEFIEDPLGSNVYRPTS